MNRKLWENVASLYGIQILAYASPLVTLPYLTRVLGPGQLGVLASAEALAAYLSMVLEYGFGLSATRDVARSRTNKLMHSDQLSSVMGAQLVLALAVIPIAFIFQHVWSSTFPHSLVRWAYSLAIARSFSPIWYFQGLEKLQLPAILSILGSIAASGGIFLFVHSPSQIWICLALRVGAAAVATLATLVLAWRETKAGPPSLRRGYNALRDGWGLFIYRSAATLYTVANPLILSLVAPPVAVGLYVGADKLVKAVASGVQPLTQAFYPRINQLIATSMAEARATMRTYALITVGLTGVAGIGLCVFASVLVRGILGHAFGNSIVVLRMMSILPPLIAANVVLTLQWMVPLGLDRQLNRIITAAGVLNVLLCSILGHIFWQNGAAISLITTEFFVLGASLLALSNTKDGSTNLPKDASPISAAAL